MGEFTGPQYLDFFVSLSRNYPERQPYPGELKFFASNTSVTGMGTEDKRVVVNPFIKLSPGARVSTHRNERTRLLLEDMGYSPKAVPTSAQKKLAQTWGGPYAQDETLLRKTIVGRILADDPTLGPYTSQQIAEAAAITKLGMAHMKKNK